VSELWVPFGAKVAYASIFQSTVDAAAANLVRLIRGRECGFDEGTAAWRRAIQDYLHSERLAELNTLGASFSVADWRRILETVLEALAD
jgi:hypothetical protein